MGAYENPALIIDRESGDNIRELQSTIAGSFSNFAKSYASKQEEIKKKLEENEKRINEINNENEKFLFSLRTDISKLSGKTSQVNLAETFEPLIQEAGRLNLGLLNNTITGQDRQKAMQTLVDIKGTVSGSFSQSLGDIAVHVETLNKAREKPLGTPGGLAKDQNPDDVKASDIMAGKLPGSKKAVFKDTNPNKLIWQVYDDKDNLVREYSAEQLKKMSDLNVEFIKIVPDRTANNESLKTAKPDIFELKPVNPKDPNSQMQATERITEAFVKKDANGVPITKEVEIGQKGSGRYKMVMEADLVEIRKNIDEILNSQLAGVTDEELMLHTNNTVNTYRVTAGLKPIYLDSDNVLSPTEKAEAMEAYKDHFVNTQIMREQDVLKEDSNVYIYEKEQSPGSNTPQGGDKLTVAQKKKIEQDNLTIKQIMSRKKDGPKGFYKMNGRGIQFDGIKFIIKGGGLDGKSVSNREKAINYLKTGSTD